MKPRFWLPVSPVVVAETLFTAKILTAYQARKIRVGRAAELLFGPFLVLDKIGEGGMGKVYKAVHVPDQRVVALKVVRPQLMSNPTVLRRYKREAAAAAALDHLNIVSLYDADEVNGRYFIAMEYVDGLDLSRMMKEYGNAPSSGLPQYQEAAEYIRQAAVGLAHAHGKGVVHCDLKPANILLDQDNKPRLADFGQSRLSHEQKPALGTIFFMAPEQADLQAVPDVRWDVYALGAILYTLLVGVPPHRNDDTVGKIDAASELEERLARYRHAIRAAPPIARLRPPSLHLEPPVSLLYLGVP